MKNALSYCEAKFSPIRCCIFFAVLFLPGMAFAQTRGKVEVIKDPLIDTLMARRVFMNKNHSSNATVGETIPGSTLSSPNSAGEETTASGYRVQIFFGSDRQRAYSAQSKFRERFPQLKTYVVYTEPNFKVRAGDFRTRLEAEKLMRDVSGMFPSLFIISEKITVSK